MDIFTILTPFFVKNNNLRFLSLCGRFGHEIGSGADVVQSCILALSKFETLTEFCMNRNGIPDDDMKKILEALAYHSKMSSITICQNIITGGAISALASLLERPHTCLAELYFSLVDSISDNEADMLAAALAKNVSLQKIKLDSIPNITVSGWRSILTHLQRSQLSTLHIDLFSNSIDNTIAILLANMLTSGMLKGINLGQSNYITTTGWRAIFGALKFPSCKLEELSITYNEFNDEDVTYLGESLSDGNCLLKTLDLESNNNDAVSTISSVGWESLALALRNPQSALEKMSLRFNDINNHDINAFAASLRGNNKMKELILGPDLDYNVSRKNWEPILDVLCNEASIDATFDSNHTLERLLLDHPHHEDELDLPNNLQSLLQINRGHPPKDAACRKIIQAHFSGEDFSMQPFIDMDLEVMPHVVSWIARDEYGQSLLYQFVRNTNLFVDIGGLKHGDMKQAGSKRQKIT